MLCKFIKHLTNSEVNWKEYSVLIVEDEPFSAKYLIGVLKKTKINILTANNAHEAIELIESGKPIDIILMDVKLPGINGLEATTIIKKKRPDIKIIAQTAYATTNDYQTAIEAGCDDYISKPIKKELLISKINEQLML